MSNENLADILLEMVEQYCHEDENGVYDSGFIGVNADAIRALIELGYMTKVHDGGGRCVQASRHGITISGINQIRTLKEEN